MNKELTYQKNKGTKSRRYRKVFKEGPIYMGGDGYKQWRESCSMYSYSRRIGPYFIFPDGRKRIESISCFNQEAL